MLIPYRSDAPVYHQPWGTIGLIALNLVIHIGLWHTGTDLETIVDWWILPFGDGFTPIRWFTSAFAHASWMHLIGNMVFLWSFGLVVEGKLGWPRFLPLYLALCPLIGIAEQILMWGASDGGSLGASSAIYGLMAIAWLWAPKNVMDCVFFFGWFIRHWELPIWGVCAFFIGWDLITALIQQRMDTALLHVLGAAAGMPLGLLLLRKGWVDCEGWDLLSLRRGSPTRVKELPALAAMVAASGGRMPTLNGGPGSGLIQPVRATARADAEAQRTAALPRLQAHLAANDVGAAEALHRDVDRATGGWRLPADDHLRLIEAHGQARSWDAAKRHCATALQDHPSLRVMATLILAQILIDIDQRPAKAQSLLRTLDEATLAPPQRDLHDMLMRRAQERLDEGVLELLD